MSAHERARLRTRLRHVNIAYSALIRNPSQEGRSVRMTALKVERQAILSLLSGEQAERRVQVTRHPGHTVGVLHAVK
jgi:hypothetical protein